MIKDFFNFLVTSFSVDPQINKWRSISWRKMTQNYQNRTQIYFFHYWNRTRNRISHSSLKFIVQRIKQKQKDQNESEKSFEHKNLQIYGTALVLKMIFFISLSAFHTTKIFLFLWRSRTKNSLNHPWRFLLISDRSFHCCCNYFAA